MAGESVDTNDTRNGKDGDEKQIRRRSTIEFPYLDQEKAIAVAKAIHDNAGTQCTIDQLAAYLKQSSTSGAFRVRLSSARIFALIETERGGGVSLTELGRDILDPKLNEQTRAESFLAVELYKEIYNKYKGHMLPPAKALELDIEAFGVTSKQKDVARQVFERSARQAGYFAHGDDKLIKPANKINISQSTAKAETKQVSELPSQGGGNNGSRLHPLIQGLIKELPEPNTEWSLDQRVKWLQAATSIFPLIYSDSSDKIIKIDDSGRISLED